MGLEALKSILRRSVNYRFRLRHGGQSAVVPVVAGVGRANRDPHEQHMLLVLEKLQRVGATGLLVDVGINIGQTLLKYILVMGREGRYIGFEPNVIAAAYVGEIVRSNGLRDAQIVTAGLGSASGLANLQMAFPGSTDPGASLSEQFRDASGYGSKVLVPVVQGDAALLALGVADRHFTLKIDTEGYELEVVRGLQQTLRDLRPFVIMEMLPPSPDQSDASHQYRRDLTSQLRATMAGLGYTISRIGQAGDLFRDPDAQGHLFTADYLFIPTERVADLVLR